MSRKTVLPVILSILLLLALSLLAACSDGVSESDFEELEEELRITNDTLEIAKLTTDYAYAVDHKDIDRMMGIWSQDAVYDLSNLGFGSVEGYDAIKGFMLEVVLSGEPWCFSSISNIDVTFTGADTAEGFDYFIHNGYVPVEVDANGQVIRKYSQFDPETSDLLDGPTDLVKSYKEGLHVYKFIKENGEWKISWMQGQPLFSAEDELVSPEQITPEMSDFFTSS